MDGSVLGEKRSFKMLGLTFSPKLNWGSYNIAIAKAASKEIGTLICSMKFISEEFALCLYKSMTMHGILLLCLGWCSMLLLGISRQATKTDIQNCSSFHCCLS